MRLFENLCTVAKKRNKFAGTTGWPLLWAVWLATNAHLEAEAWVRNLGEELKLKKDMQLCTPLLTSGPADKVEEKNGKLETIAYYFTKQEEHSCCRLVFKCLWQSLITMLTGIIPGKMMRVKAKHVVVIEDKTDRVSHSCWPLIQLTAFSTVEGWKFSL